MSALAASRIGIVGGLDRVESRYARIASDAGFEAVFHDGHLAGRGRDALAQLVERCDHVVILTDVNSHGAVQFARNRMRFLGREPILLRKCGATRFAAMLAALRPVVEDDLRRCAGIR